MPRPLSNLQVEIARQLAFRAFDGQRTTYRELAKAVGWAHPMGRGLGAHLWEVLNFTHEQGLPCLTSILVEGGTRAPPPGAIEYIQDVYGEISIAEEQARVFEFNWAAVSELNFEQPAAADIDFDRIYATRTWGFDPANWGMASFSLNGTRERILEEMGGQPIYIVCFCSQNTEVIEGTDRHTIAEADRARVLGILEVQPIRAEAETHVSPAALERMMRDWGKIRWPYGLKATRAWKFSPPPWTREALPRARSLSWEVTQAIVPLTDEERAMVRQYALDEVSVFGQPRKEVKIGFREPMHTTYLAFCDDPAVLSKTQAPAGTKLVKIGVSGDTSRRLRDLNDHHFAKIFGLSFRMWGTCRWGSQDEALSRETAALEWALQNTTHASGEYFFMTEGQTMEALFKVKPPKTVR